MRVNEVLRLDIYPKGDLVQGEHLSIAIVDEGVSFVMEKYFYKFPPHICHMVFSPSEVDKIIAALQTYKEEIK